MEELILATYSKLFLFVNTTTFVDQEGLELCIEDAIIDYVKTIRPLGLDGGIEEMVRALCSQMSVAGKQSLRASLLKEDPSFLEMKWLAAD